ncbi:MAG: UPF0016 domain-containing protein [Candidatus Aenigmatarchaeota archaeon]|nr:MAG: UPF0016 domain-containing protein [Candidatus Aenigmarchaeota archaeon]
MMIDFILPLAIVALAELGDKSQLCIFIMSSMTRCHLHVFAGVMLAFALADGIAVFLGSWVSGLLPMGILRMASGLVFIAFGLVSLYGDGVSGKCDSRIRSPFIGAFTMIFLTEWGDKTQIMSGIMSTLYNPVLVFSGVITALAGLSLLAMATGSVASKKVGEAKLNNITAVAFIVMGAAFLLLPG